MECDVTLRLHIRWKRFFFQFCLHLFQPFSIPVVICCVPGGKELVAGQHLGCSCRCLRCLHFIPVPSVVLLHGIVMAPLFIAVIVLVMRGDRREEIGRLTDTEVVLMLWVHAIRQAMFSCTGCIRANSCFVARLKSNDQAHGFVFILCRILMVAVKYAFCCDADYFQMTGREGVRRRSSTFTAASKNGSAHHDDAHEHEIECAAFLLAE